MNVLLKREFGGCGVKAMSRRAVAAAVVVGLASVLAAGPVLADEQSRAYGDEQRGEHYSSKAAESKLYGMVDKLPPGRIGIWVVNGREITVTRDTRIKEKYGVATAGSYVKVKGHNTGKAFIARKIEVKRPRE